MRRRYLIASLAAVISALAATAVVNARMADPGAPTVSLIPIKNHVHGDEELAGLCPWRNPETDLKAFFPMATGYHEETLILSGKRLEIGRRLGRTPTAEDNALKIYGIYRSNSKLGNVVARRIRGEFGVIELVLAISNPGAVLGAKIQRSREPLETLQSLQSQRWISSFCGRTSSSPWKLGDDIPDVPLQARATAGSILEGARTAMILLDVGKRTDSHFVAR